MRYNKILIALCAGYWLLINSCETNKLPNMPSFNLLLADSTTVLNSDDIPQGEPVMLMFFSPDCEHCQEETETLLTNIESLKNIRIYFITVDALDRMRVFNRHYQLYRYQNVIVGRDYNFDMVKNYQIPTTPFIVLFNKYKQAKVIIKGPCSIRWLLQQINKL